MFYRCSQTSQVWQACWWCCWHTRHALSIQSQSATKPSPPQPLDSQSSPLASLASIQRYASPWRHLLGQLWKLWMLPAIGWSLHSEASREKNLCNYLTYSKKITSVCRESLIKVHRLYLKSACCEVVFAIRSTSLAEEFFLGSSQMSQNMGTPMVINLLWNIDRSCRWKHSPNVLARSSCSGAGMIGSWEAVDLRALTGCQTEPKQLQWKKRLLSKPSAWMWFGMKFVWCYKF